MFINKLFRTVEKEVRLSYHSYPYEEREKPEERLNHANTYYWYARYRKNGQKEFDKSRELAHSVAREARDSLSELAKRNISNAAKGIPLDNNHWDSLLRQANTLIKFCEQQKHVSNLNIAAHYPTYLEVMGHDLEFMEQDCERSEINIRGANRAVDDLLNLISPEKNAKISERPLFALVQAVDEQPEIQESLTQKLNAESQFYTIAKHEITRVFNRELDVQDLFADTAGLQKIARYFRTGTIALITLTNLDKVDGIHYYGLKYEVWHAQEGRVKDAVYTEFFLRDRIFNQLTVSKLPLFLIFLMLATLISFGFQFCEILGRSKGRDLSMILGWSDVFRIPLVFSVGVVVSVVFVDWFLVSFLNPKPHEYYASDMGEIWGYAYPGGLLILIPALSYLLLGKLDNLISAFQSRLDNAIGLFGLFMGSLLVLPFVAMNYDLLRNGVNELWVGINGALCLVFYAMGAWNCAINMSRLINAPQKSDPFIRMFWLLNLLLTLCALAVYSYSLLVVNQFDWQGIIYMTLVFLMTIIPFTRWYRSRNRKEKAWQSNSKSTLRLTIKNDEKWDFKLNESNTNSTQDKKSRRGQIRVLVKGEKTEQLVSWYHLSAEMGNPCRNYIDNKLKNLKGVVLRSIDCSVVAEPKWAHIHYFPFAKAFEDELAYDQFNDVAEKARVATNVLARLLSGFFTASEKLIDEGEVRPRNPRELGIILAKKLIAEGKRGSLVLVLDHCEKLNDECFALLKEMIFSLRSMMGTDDIPLVISCTYGRHSMEEELVDLAQQYMGEQRILGNELRKVIQFRVEMDDAAHEYILTQFSECVREYMHSIKPDRSMDVVYPSLDVFSRNKLEEFLVQNQVNQSPQIISAVVRGMLRKNVICKVKAPQGADYWRFRPDGDLDSKEYKLTQRNFLGLRKQHPELFILLKAAAYCADAEGVFRLSIVQSCTSEDRLTLIQMMEQAQDLQLLSDLQELENNDLYRFSDRTMVAELVQRRSVEQEAHNQLSREYYARYVEFFVKEVDPKNVYSHLIHLKGRKGLTKNELIALYRNAWYSKNHPVFRGYVGYLSLAAAQIFLNETDWCNLEHARKACLNAEEFQREEGMEMIEKSVMRATHFKILVESGLKEEAWKYWKEHFEKHQEVGARVREEQSMLDVQLYFIRLCFLSGPDERYAAGKALTRGSFLCEQLEERGDNKIVLLRLKFYTIKLIPNREKSIIVNGNELDLNDARKEKIKEVLKKYVDLLQDLKNLKEGGVIKNRQLIEIQQLNIEVLNDFTGFLVDFILVHKGKDNWKGIIEQLGLNIYAEELSDIVGTDAEPVEKLVEWCFKQRLSHEPALYEHFFGDSEQANNQLRKPSVGSFLRDHALNWRNLAFTFGYYQRFFFYLRNFDDSLAMGKWAYQINKYVSDLAGRYMSPAFMANSCYATEHFRDAFDWQEEAYGFAQESWNKEICIKKFAVIYRRLNEQEQQETRARFLFCREHQIYDHLLPHYMSGAFLSSFAKVQLSEQYCLQKQKMYKSKFNGDLGTNPEVLIPWIYSLYKKAEDGLVNRGANEKEGMKEVKFSTPLSVGADQVQVVCCWREETQKNECLTPQNVVYKKVVLEFTLNRLNDQPYMIGYDALHEISPENQMHFTRIGSAYYAPENDPQFPMSQTNKLMAVFSSLAEVDGNKLADENSRFGPDLVTVSPGRYAPAFADEEFWNKYGFSRCMPT